MGGDRMFWLVLRELSFLQWLLIAIILAPILYVICALSYNWIFVRFILPWQIAGKRKRKKYQKPLSSLSSAFSSADYSEGTGGKWYSSSRSVQPDESLTVYDGKGHPLELTISGNKMANGGEGTVYTIPVPGKEHILVKVYNDRILQDEKKMAVIRERLQAMEAKKNLAKNKCFAWPLMLVYNDKKEVIGFAMNRCEGKSFLNFKFGPRGVKQSFPNWDRSHLVKTVLDFLQKLELLKSHGVLVNDFNPSNFLVNDNCQVSFIDCDSFQVTAEGGKDYITRVYFPGYVAPEMMKDTDRFGLHRGEEQMVFAAAITVFQTIMCGMYPYSYTDGRKKDPSDLSEEAKLLEGKCPLKPGSKYDFPQGKWINLWKWLNEPLRKAFIQTFHDGYKNENQRASLEQFCQALSDLHDLMMKEPSRRDLAPLSPPPCDPKAIQVEQSESASPKKGKIRKAKRN